METVSIKRIWQGDILKPSSPIIIFSSRTFLCYKLTIGTICEHFLYPDLFYHPFIWRGIGMLDQPCNLSSHMRDLRHWWRKSCLKHQTFPAIVIYNSAFCSLNIGCNVTIGAKGFWQRSLVLIDKWRLENLAPRTQEAHILQEIRILGQRTGAELKLSKRTITLTKRHRCIWKQWQQMRSTHREIKYTNSSCYNTEYDLLSNPRSRYCWRRGCWIYITKYTSQVLSALVSAFHKIVHLLLVKIIH